MSDWRVAPAVKALFTQADLQAPDRNDKSDGTIGDARHRASTSDHNPAADGFVYAGDLTDDDSAGIDCREIARQIVARKDRRVKYLISEGRMVSSYPTGRYPAWTWRPYSGVNGHFKHLHVSVLPKWRNDTSPWWAPPATPDEEDDGDMTPKQAEQLDKLSRDMREFANILNKIAAKVDIDGKPSRLEILNVGTVDWKVES